MTPPPRETAGAGGAPRADEARGACSEGEVAAVAAVEAAPAGGREIFGDGFEKVGAFADLLVAEGELRGLIGPRELPRLWTRHLVNSAAVVDFVRDGESVADVGSGAGFPGIVVAAMRPDSQVHLIETMERRCRWLTDVVEAVGLSNVTVHRARAEELHGVLEVDVVTARAVAALPKLARWCVPLLRPGGRMLAMKGRQAEAELADARSVLRKLKVTGAVVHEDVRPDPHGEGTTIVEVTRG